MIRTHDAGTLTAADTCTTGDPGRLGGAAPRPRGSGLHRPPRRQRSCPGRDPRRSVAHHLRSEYCIEVTGKVAKRPEGNANPPLPSGEIEVIAADVEVLSPSAVLPFPIDERRVAEGRRRGGGGPVAATATSTSAVPAPLPRSGCAAR